MTNHDFGLLNDKEFEMLCIDLIGRDLNVRIERYKPGKDQGIDGRFYSDKNRDAIVQVKHWSKSGILPLLRSIKNEEAKKVRELNPSRYIFATSVELSPHDKTKIVALFSPYIKNTAEVYGRDDIQHLISENEDIERRYYKLWLTSFENLKSVFSAGILGRSRFSMEEIRGRVSLYVVTKAHEEGLKLLRSKRVLVITGEPGVGKTTLAEHLSLFYSIRGFEIVVLENSINEAEAVWNEERKQFFYFDDFLGRNYLESLQRHEDSHIMGFIRRISKLKNKRFVLTSRSTILNRGKQLTELFKIGNMQEREYELRIDGLTRLDKAKILYNHVYFSDLAGEIVDEIYKKKRYLEVIDHKNYNPRLISFVTDAVKMKQVGASKYWAHVMGLLNNPADVWENVYERQLDDVGRLILSILILYGGDVDEQTLQKGCVDYLLKSGHSASLCSRLWKDAIRVCVGAVVNRVIDADDDKVRIELYNPSVGDYVIRRLAEEPRLILEYVEILGNAEVVERIEAFYRQQSIKANEFDVILKTLSRRELPADASWDPFCMSILKLALKHPSLITKKYWSTWADVILSSERFGNVRTTGLVLIYLEGEGYVDLKNKRVKGCISRIIAQSDSIDDLEPLAVFWDGRDEEMDCVADKFTEKFESVMVDTIRDQIYYEGLLDDYYPTDIDKERAEGKLRSYIENKFGEFNVGSHSRIIDRIVEAADVDSILESNGDGSRSGGTSSSFKSPGLSVIDEDVQIVDLFERSI